MSARDRTPPDDAFERRFRGLLEAAPDAMVVADQGGRIVLVNSEAVSLFGYSREDLLGRPVEDLIPLRFRDAHPARRAEYALDPHRRPMGAGLELSACRRDGTEFPAEISLSPFEGPGGERLTITAIRDVTARKRAEGKFRGLLEGAPDAMVIVDASGRIVLVNTQTEKLFGYTREELLGSPVETLVPEASRASHPANRATYFAAPQPRPMGSGLQLSGRRKDGTTFPVEISLSPVVTEEGTLVIAAVRDVTERQRLAEQLRVKNEELEQRYRELQEANRLKSLFVANMSHELRTPLNAIIGFAELMHDGKVGQVSDDQHEFLGDILTSSRHLLELIDGVLDLARVESGKVEFRFAPVDLEALLGEVKDILRGLAETKRITVSAEVDPALPLVIGDAGKLKQMLYNFLSNALKFTPDGGRVTLRARGEGPGEFRLEVEDSGIGINPEDHPRLFVEFQQLDAGTTKKYPGTGLGLALTKRLAEAQGGRVGVLPARGQGSTFFAVLPHRLRDGAAEPRPGDAPEE